MLDDLLRIFPRMHVYLIILNLIVIIATLKLYMSWLVDFYFITKMFILPRIFLFLNKNLNMLSLQFIFYFIFSALLS